MVAVLDDAFYSDEVRRTFEMVYPSGVYRTFASQLEDTKVYRSEQNACIALAVA